MERYKMLITGKNDLIIDDIFIQLTDTFDMLYCSSRFDDMRRHIEVFGPQVFVICLNNESTNEFTNFSDLRRKLTSKDIFTVVIGKKDECDNFERHAFQVADMVLTRPINTDTIREQITREMEYRKQEQQESAHILEALEAVKKQQEKKRVLVIDDDPLMLKLVKEYLGDNYSVATAVSGKIAYKFLETKETNMILLDYEMPEENGVAVLKHIRENEKLANIPVVFLTGIKDKEKLLQALVLKPQGYLIKPVDKEKLMGTVERFIG